MTLQIALNAAGGLALFLLAMAMMTEGLKVFAGGGLRRLLGRWTSTPLHGVFSGVLVTSVVQSSSAVTIATIGFVNAGVLTLQQALGVIFGTNVGTTTTGWRPRTNAACSPSVAKIRAGPTPNVRRRWTVFWKPISGPRRHCSAPPSHGAWW
jgi:hypothetical protein